MFFSDHVPNTYFYEFDYTPSIMAGQRPPWHDGGLDHGFDLFFTLGMGLTEGAFPGFNLTDDDVAMCKLAIQYWANFIKTG